MTSGSIFRIGALVVTALLIVPAGKGSAEDAYLSPLALAVSGNDVFVAEYTAKQVAVLELNKRSIRGFLKLPGQPSGLALSSDAKTLYVTGGDQDGQVYVLDIGEETISGSHAAGHSPIAPVLSPDGKILYVCKQFDDSVMSLNLETGGTVDAHVSREPVAAAITPDGAKLLVANLVPATRSDDNYVSAAVDVIDTKEMAVAATITLTNGSSSLLGICVSPDGKYAYVTHILSRYHLPTTQLARGWINTNAVSVIDTESMSLVNTFLLDDVDLGAANPWGITCSPDGERLIVAHSGPHEISIIDRRALHDKLDGKAQAGDAGDVPNDLSFLAGIRERVKLRGKGPRGVALSNGTVLVAEYFSGSLGIVDIQDNGKFEVSSVPVGEEPPLSVVRTGEMLFHDASICFQQWQSCASCHPGNARVDGLNWDNLNDGLGSPKNTKNLLLSYDTPPTTVTGVRPNAEASTRAGIRFMLFNKLPEEAAVSLDEYLKSLKPVLSPKLIDGELSPAALRGKEVFNTAECGKCHSAPLFTDMKKHRVGTNTDLETRAFDTPTLVEVWRTAPYLHDGRAATMLEVLENKEHGETAELTDAEKSDLAEYVLSL